MIDRAALLKDAQRVTDLLVDDLRDRTDGDEDTRLRVRGEYERASSAGRTDRTYEEWREDLLAQVAPAWTLATVFVRFCEDNGLIDRPLLSGPGRTLELARDERTDWFREHPEQGDRAWLHEVLSRCRELPGLGPILGDDNPLWQIAPSADGARALLELWWATDADGELVHDFNDDELDTRFLGDLYQDLSGHARKQFALLQTPEFVEKFILDHTLDPALETFGLPGFRMIDPTCGSGHFLLGAFDRLLEAWRQREPATSSRTLAQHALDSVNGVDINPFAVAVARFRLLVAALKACRIGRLADAPNFTINVAAGDSLLHGSRGSRLFGAEPEFSSTLAHRYAFEDDRAHLLLEADRYHAVVGNPPYITPAEPALTAIYRNLYETAYREFQLTVPFIERFFDLSLPEASEHAAGFVGAIVGNAFMAREFGTRFVNDFLALRDVRAVIDTSGAYIPGHGTSTVILFARSTAVSDDPIRAVLGIRGEPGEPSDPSSGEVWTAIVEQFDVPGSESEYISVEDAERARFATHPWSLQGGAAGRLNSQLENAAVETLGQLIRLAGYTGQTNADAAFLAPEASLRRRGVEDHLWRELITGEVVREWRLSANTAALFPYDTETGSLVEIEQHPGLYRWLWPLRTITWTRRTFNKKSYRQDGRTWWEWHQVALDRVTDPTISFGEVASHWHFVLDRGEKIYNRTAPMLKLPSAADDEVFLSLLGLLNSSVSEFWAKQTFYPKGGDRVGNSGARLSQEPWSDRYQRDTTKLKQFPIPDGAPTERAREVDRLAQKLSATLPAAVAEREAPTAAALSTAGEEAAALRRRMVALQEELDWECYRLYGLVDEDLTLPTVDLPAIDRGQRAFEIALARRMASGEATSTWFDRHGSTPITELPGDWPDAYRTLVERRLELIAADRAIRLLEKPEHKRRWNWDTLEELAEEAQELWLLDRIEALLADRDADEPEVTTTARLADRLAEDDAARQVAQDLGGRGTELVDLVDRLVRSEAVPYLAPHRHKPSGLRKRVEWERVWELQRVEDAIDARTELPEDDPDHLTASEVEVERKARGLDRIPVPPNYTKADFADGVTYRLRGKLDVPKERFIRYPDVQVGADTSTVVGWAGWDHLQQVRALAGLYAQRKDAGADTPELGRLLAGMAELLPWVRQWHDEPDPVYGERMGQVFTSFVDTERAALGLAAEDLTGDAPLTL